MGPSANVAPGSGAARRRPKAWRAWTNAALVAAVACTVASPALPVAAGAATHARTQATASATASGATTAPTDRTKASAPATGKATGATKTSPPDTKAGGTGPASQRPATRQKKTATTATTATSTSTTTTAGSRAAPRTTRAAASEAPASAGSTARAGRTAGAAPATRTVSTPKPGQPKRSAGGQTAPDVVTRIVDRVVEVIPLWAKALMIALSAMVVALALGAHLRLRHRAAEYHHQALHDPLTDLPNRTLFRDRVAQALLDAELRGEQVAVMLIDLDGFKEVNDTLGHFSGDRLLEEVSLRLINTIRAGDTVARLGGDEFAVILPSVAGEAAATQVANVLRRALQAPFLVEGLSVHSDASIGIAIAPRHGDDADTLLRHADVAMYSAKERHLGTAVYSARLDRYSPDRLAMTGELRRAIGRGQLELFYQPQVSPASGRVDAVEALVRWRHPQRGLVAPDEFLPLAERTGLMRALTLWVLESAIRECAAWRKGGLDLHVAVNLSAGNLVDVALPNEIERLLRRWKVPPHVVHLEITETTAMSDPARTRAVLARLNALGTPLTIDDFGTGYSSMSHLRSLPVQELKIDRSFVSRMATNPNDHAIVVATIELGHALGLRIVAEGVEDRATLRELAARGCDVVQGYLFAEPLTVRELQAWLAAWPGSTWKGPAARRHAGVEVLPPAKSKVLARA